MTGFDSVQGRLVVMIWLCFMAIVDVGDAMQSGLYLGAGVEADWPLWCSRQELSCTCSSSHDRLGERVEAAAHISVVLGV